MLSGRVSDSWTFSARYQYVDLGFGGFGAAFAKSTQSITCRASGVECGQLLGSRHQGTERDAHDRRPGKLVVAGNGYARWRYPLDSNGPHLGPRRIAGYSQGSV